MYNGCSPSYLNTVFGMKLCGKLLYHEKDQNSLDVYLAGPFAMSVKLQKVDQFSKYTFFYTWRADQSNRNYQILTATYDTPGSKINRRSSLDLKYDKVFYRYVSLAMEMPVYDIKSTFVYDWSLNKIMAKSELIMDQRKIGSFYYIVKSNGLMSLESEAIVTYGNDEIIHWNGDFLFTDLKKTMHCHLQGSLVPSEIELKGM